MKNALVILLLIASGNVFSSSLNLFTLHRLNYKSHKELRYDVKYDQATCTISERSPIDVYYVKKATGERISEFSSGSKRYFGAKYSSSNLTHETLQFTFGALEEIGKKLNTTMKLVAHLETTPTGCKAYAKLSYNVEAYRLIHINLNMKKLFGAVTGVKSIEVKGQNRRGSFTTCVFGKCR